MTTNDSKLLRIRKKNDEKNKRMLNESIIEASIIGKEAFDFQKLNKVWTFRNEKKLTEKQVERAIKDIERDYYLAGKRFMTMDQYAKYLMEVELYR